MMNSGEDKVKLSIRERIAVQMLWLLCWCVAIAPHWVRYRIYAPIVRIFMQRIVSYRREVVESNIARCLPELSERERTIIRDNFYLYLSEIIISTLSLARATSWRTAFPKGENRDDREAEEREGTLENMRKSLNGQSAVVLTAHYGLWEYILFYGRFSGVTSIGAYHPLESRIADELFKRLRRDVKGFVIPSSEVVRFAMRCGKHYQGEGYMLGLIADQNPPLRRDTNWYRFLAEETIFFEGAERIAQKMGMPVYYIDQIRRAPGRYEMQQQQIWDGTESVEPTEITRRYVKLLERSIRNQPHIWLWSHKRFKKSKRQQMEWFNMPHEPKTIE